jgi:hypothetical protein
MQTVRRRNDQTARISLQFHQCQRATQRQNKTETLEPLAYPVRLISRFSKPRRRNNRASTRHRHVAASVSRYLRRHNKTRKREKTDYDSFFTETGFIYKILGLAQLSPPRTLLCSNNAAPAPARFRPGWPPAAGGCAMPGPAAGSRRPQGTKAALAARP